jgi:hypothetical protein
MKFYEFIIIFLKVATVTQLTLIFFKLQASDSLFYLFTDLLYKLTLGLFLLTFFYFNKTTGVDGWDELIISFGGVVILYDAWIMDIASILKAYNIKFNPYTLN